MTVSHCTGICDITPASLSALSRLMEAQVLARSLLAIWYKTRPRGVRKRRCEVVQREQIVLGVGQVLQELLQVLEW
ncbi:hypothetical protein AU468_13560 [Alkalispirochaeta sphaeroplastigenens]|uniref:Uncharacterized protein n=1 Tax=Alkalispirochaeta sphaeroplastigenens TaxID=1187066 RepID=A0A2S4JFN8_9SPIO|nr:hypothetical protein AU468_13560 [Alkalispirochaeta sphaeroplastigenens]